MQKRRNPNGVVSLLSTFTSGHGTTPLGLAFFLNLFPRVASKLGNPGLEDSTPLGLRVYRVIPFLKPVGVGLGPAFPAVHVFGLFRR